MSIKQTTCPPASGQVVFVCLSRNQCKFTRFVCRLSAGNEEHCGEQYADDPGAEADIFDLAGEELDVLAMRNHCFTHSLSIIFQKFLSLGADILRRLPS